jgi:hypothetical protein
MISIITDFFLETETNHNLPQTPPLKIQRLAPRLRSKGKCTHKILKPHLAIPLDTTP